MKLTSSQEEAYNHILEFIKQNKTPILVKGNSGVGKTLISNNISKLKRYKTFNITNNFFYKYKYLFSNIKRINESTTEINQVYSFINIIIYLFIKLFALFIRLRRSKNNQLDIDEEEYISFFLLNLYIKFNKNTIIIIDEINFLNDEYIDIINQILFNKNFRNHFSYLSTIKYIIFYCNSYYTSNSLSRILKRFENKVIISDYTIDDIKCILNDNIINDRLELIFPLLKEITLHSNLSLLLLIYKDIRYNKTNKFSYSCRNNELMILIEKYLKNELYLKNILKSITIPFNDITIKEVIEICNKFYALTSDVTKEGIINLIIKRIVTTNSDILLSNDGTLNFTNYHLKKIFQPTDSLELKGLYKIYSQVLAELFPGDYIERLKAYKIAGMLEDYQIYKALYLVQCYRNGSSYTYQNTLHKYEQYLNIIRNSYDYFYSSQSDKAIRELEKINLISIPDILRFEKEYLELQIGMVTGEKIFFYEVIERMKFYIKKFPYESEIIVRSRMLIFLSYLYLGQNQKMHYEFQKIINSVDLLSKTNIKYQYYIYVLKRRSLMFSSAETAYSETLECIEYFEGIHIMNRKLLIREYFYSLINHSDNCRNVFKYEESLISITKAYDLYNNFNVFLPKLTLYNNYAIIQYENNIIDYNMAIKILLDLVENVDVLASKESTYYIVYNNIASLYAINNQLEEAKRNIEYANIILNNTKEKIDNHYFMINKTRSIILYLQNDYENAINIIKDIKYKSTYIFSKSINLEIINILHDVFQSKLKIDTYDEMVQHIRNVLCSKSNKIIQPLKLWCMQYWSK